MKFGEALEHMREGRRVQRTADPHYAIQYTNGYCFERVSLVTGLRDTWHGGSAADLLALDWELVP